jgi:hypothetical protein
MQPDLCGTTHPQYPVERCRSEERRAIIQQHRRENHRRGTPCCCQPDLAEPLPFLHILSPILASSSTLVQLCQRSPAALEHPLHTYLNAMPRARAPSAASALQLSKMCGLEAPTSGHTRCTKPTAAPCCSAAAVNTLQPGAAVTPSSAGGCASPPPSTNTHIQAHKHERKHPAHSRPAPHASAPRPTDSNVAAQPPAQQHPSAPRPVPR